MLDNTGTIRLLESLPGSGVDGGRNYKLREYPWQNCPAYDVIEYTSVSNQDSSSSILVDGEEAVVEPTLGYALSHWEHHNRSQQLWTQSLCHDSTQLLNSKQLSPLLKKIRTKADLIIIWIGRDHEDDDILRHYLGPGTDSSTESAFEICQSLMDVQDPEEDLRQYIIMESPHSQRAKLCHLMNLLYRPWFRELPILRTNYLDDISSLMVGCGTRFTKWASIKIVAERIRLIEPIPRLLVDDITEIFESDAHFQDWIQAREDFGFSTLQLLAQVVWLENQLSEGQSDTEEERNNVLSFGCAIDSSSGMTSDIRKILMPTITKNYAKEDARAQSPITLASLESSSSRATPRIRGVLDPAPDPVYQAPYVHRPAKSRFLDLFVLFPQGKGENSIIQGTFISRFEDDVETPFISVANSSLKRYRRNSHILVDGQSLLVPEALEVFFRRVRDPIVEQRFFIPSICMHPQVVDELAEQRGIYGRALYNAYRAAISVLSVGFIDLYDVLIEAAEETAHERQGDLNADDWLLDILEEAVTDTPAKEQIEEEEQRKYPYVTILRSRQYNLNGDFRVINQCEGSTLWDEVDVKLSTNERTVTCFYDLKRSTNTTSSMDAGADPRTWSISNLELSDLIWFAIVHT
ncbi:MAG: hypothetical protein LQ349_007258 [Xanthoria aureola]|nr:MAG: hypothetical protein LQ349_007258 [Xanthoria aureola]